MRKLFFLLLAVVLFSSCSKYLRTGIMLKTPKTYKFDKLSDSLTKEDYRIAPNNDIQFRVFSNDGFKLIDLTNSMGGGFNDVSSTVDTEGNLKLPLLGNVKIAGYTIHQAEMMLEDKYAEYYVKPYVQLKVTNKRVIVFPGLGGAARVVLIQNNNTTVFEALAQAGGITEDGRAYRVKLIRNAGPKPQVFLMDLSRIDGLAAGNTVVLANDIIYVEPRIRWGKRFLQEVTPYVSLLSSFLLVYSIFKK